MMDIIQAEAACAHGIPAVMFRLYILPVISRQVATCTRGSLVPNFTSVQTYNATHHGVQSKSRQQKDTTRINAILATTGAAVTTAAAGSSYTPGAINRRTVTMSRLSESGGSEGG